MDVAAGARAGPGARKAGEEGLSEKGQALNFESQLDAVKALGDSEASPKGAGWGSRPHGLRGTRSAAASAGARNFLK